MDADAAYLEALPDAVVVCDAGGSVVYANAAALRLLRAGAGEIAGRPLDEAVPLRDGLGRPWWACSRKARALPGVRRTPPRDLDLVAGERTVPVSLAASFVRDPGGRLLRAVCVLRDSSSGMRATVRRGELISTLAHELRSPLASVKGFTTTLLARWERFSDQQRRHMLETVDADADRIHRLIQELLDVSRIEAGRLSLRRQIVDVAAVAREVADRFERLEASDERFRDRPRHAFAIDFAPGLPSVYADRGKIEQVLTNLVENSVKYADKGGTITIAGLQADGMVEVAVLDEGPGIPAERLGMVFSKFYRRGPGHSLPSGIGLGLYISRGLVEAHGGRIWAVPRARGADVRFRLPRGELE